MGRAQERSCDGGLDKLGELVEQQQQRLVVQLSTLEASCSLSDIGLYDVYDLQWRGLLPRLVLKSVGSSIWYHRLLFSAAVSCETFLLVQVIGMACHVLHNATAQVHCVHGEPPTLGESARAH